jgi:hypothetical protein
MLICDLYTFTPFSASFAITYAAPYTALDAAFAITYAAPYTALDASFAITYAAPYTALDAAFSASTSLPFVIIYFFSLVCVKTSRSNDKTEHLKGPQA